MKVVDAWTKTEDCFAFGLYTNAGVARFKSEDAMWAYLKREDTKVQFEVDGQRVYMNRDVRKPPEDEARDKAVLIYGDLSAWNVGSRKI